jgi:hypothetical protein
MAILGRRLAIALVAASLAASTASAAGRPAPSTYGEYEVKAAFIYNFAKFIDWPAESLGRPGEAMNVCILGEDPFGGILERTLQAKTVHGRALRIERLGGVSDLQSCQIIFISASESRRLPHILEILWGSPVLTIGETPDFGSAGGIINFVIEDSRVRFEINAGAAARSGLRISSKLLSLARVVTDGRQTKAR